MITKYVIQKNVQITQDLRPRQDQGTFARVGNPKFHILIQFLLHLLSQLLVLSATTVATLILTIKMEFGATHKIPTLSGNTVIRLLSTNNALAPTATATVENKIKAEVANNAKLGMLKHPKVIAIFQY